MIVTIWGPEQGTWQTGLNNRVVGGLELHIIAEVLHGGVKTVLVDLDLREEAASSSPVLLRVHQGEAQGKQKDRAHLRGSASLNETEKLNDTNRWGRGP